MKTKNMEDAYLSEMELAQLLGGGEAPVDNLNKADECKCDNRPTSARWGSDNKNKSEGCTCYCNPI